MSAPADSIRSVLVTGASGFVGSEVCATLVAAGLTVHGLTRDRGRDLVAGVTPRFAADLSEKTALKAAMRDVDAVVHLAARAHITRERESDAETLFHRTNVEGTRSVFDAAVAVGVRRFIFASSLKVMGDYQGRPWTEEDPPSPVDAYGRSKLAAENVLVRSGPSSDVEIGILRLPLAYGPGVRANMLQLFKLVDRGIPLPFADIRNRRTIVFSRNAADAVLELLRIPSLTREVFFVGDAEALSTEALIRGIGTALGRPPRLFHLPQRILIGIAKVGDLAEYLLPSPLTSSTLERLTGSLECSTSKLQAATGYRPRWSTEMGLKITADWYAMHRRQPSRA